MSMFDRLTGLASQALNKPPAPSGAKPHGWQNTIRGAVDALSGPRNPTVAGDRTPSAPAPATSPTLTPPTDVPAARTGRPGLVPPPPGEDEAERAAVARYQYLLQTADPAQLERIHADAIGGLAPGDRRQLEARLRAELPPHEQPRSSDPADLARTATRAEATRPGLLPGILARTPRGGASTTGAEDGLLVAVAGAAVLSAAAAPLLADALTAGVNFDALAGIDLQGVGAGLGDAAASAADLAGGATDLAGGAADLAAGATEHVAGWGEGITGIGEQLSNLEIPGLGKLFGN